ncbi:MAG: hypothetical protein ABSH51_11980 [Solirubrobacteraceae bacterium]|jgi:hypothetical protein
MSRELEAPRTRTPIVRRAAAGLVLVVAAALAIHLVIGLIMTVFWVVVVVAAVGAVVWAMRNI